jgi:periplasmic divalent cation tolerance protein
MICNLKFRRTFLRRFAYFQSCRQFMNSDADLSETGPLLVLCSCPASDAARIAEVLVERRLAACVQCLPGMRAVYRWKETVEHGEESLLLIKTTAAAYPGLQAALVELHPYELPEIIVTPIIGGLPDYLSWVRACVA